MDRVSNLPDDVICHILSSLPTKQAVLTSTLSKRWVNLWKLVPNLDINDSLFLNPEEGKGERHEIRQSFVHFMNTVLASQGDTPIQRFSLKCITGIHPNDVNRWICYVLERGVSNLKLFLDFAEEDVEYGYQLPDEMFVNETLAELELKSEVCVDWWHGAGGTFLPMLKRLDIHSAKICYDEIDLFIPSFTVLEELRMAKMEWMDENVTMSSTSLKKLSIKAIGCKGCVNPKSISFDTPNLLSLIYVDLVAEDYPLVNMGKLTQARIKLMLFDEQVERIRVLNNVGLEDDGEDDEVLRFGNVVKLMKGIRNVQELYLFGHTVEVLSLCCESMPVFNNLKFIGIKSEKGFGWQAMPVLLKNCPHLETILLQGLVHHVTDKCGDACPCISREDKGRSLKSCPVKLTTIQGFRGTVEEMQIIRHFLDYFPCLKEMKVYIEEHDPTRLTNRKMLKLVVELFDLYNKLSSCNVQLLVSGYLNTMWTAQGNM